MTFGQKLKELREQRGMTQASFAQTSKVPIGTIRDYEQDKREPLLSNAQKLARALGVSLDVFPFCSEEDGAARRPAKQLNKPRRPRRQ
jgi:transcriptional regulator with XRE-family HTH domain